MICIDQKKKIMVTQRLEVIWRGIRMGRFMQSIVPACHSSISRPQLSNFSSTNLTVSSNMATTIRAVLAINPAKSFKTYVRTCVSLFETFSSQGLITQGNALHAHLIKTGFSSQRYIAIKLLVLYLNCRKFSEIDQILKDFDGFDLVASNYMISANIQWGNLNQARLLFDEMPERNEVSWSALISGFMKYGRVEESMWYFERNPFQNVVSWTAAISGLVQNRMNFDAVKLFLRLLESEVRPNDVTFTSIFRACGELGDFGLGISVLGLVVKAGFEHYLSISNSLITLSLRMGEIDLARRVFDRMEKRDVVSWTAILDVYVETGDLLEVRRIFDQMPERNEVSWSAMIARYNQSGYAKEALKLFLKMIQEGFAPNVSCFSCTLSALASLKALSTGTNIHGHTIKAGTDKDVFIGSSLIDLYCKCGEPDDGRLVFDSILEKNVVCWNSMVGGYSINARMEEAEELFELMPEKNDDSWGTIIAGYLENEQYKKVLEVFNTLLLSGQIPNKSTFSSVLSVCASIASLDKGMDVHGKIIKLGIQYNDVFIGTALMGMYAKCGDIQSTRQVFKRMPEKNTISWTVMIQGLAESGFAEESLMLFEGMERTSEVAPDELMLLSVLFACSHCGLVDKGLKYFNSMEKVYGIKPQAKHYTCVVDLLARSGRLNEAEEFIRSLSFQPEANAFAALLSGCNKYKNAQVGERTAKKLWELAEKNSAGYVLLSNIYASDGRWIDVSNVRKFMRERGLKKSGGCSWVEVRNQVNSFYSEDRSHFQSDEIYGTLQLLRSEMLVP